LHNATTLWPDPITNLTDPLMEAKLRLYSCLNHDENAKIMKRIDIRPVILIIFMLLAACTSSNDVRKNSEPSPVPLTAAEFFKLIGKSDTKAVKLMIGAGMDPNVSNPDDKMGTTTLQAAIGNTKTMKALIAAGANVNAADRSGNTPLIWAARAGQTEAVKVLLAAGADVNLKNLAGLTPLMDAARRGYSETSKLLLKKGADVNATTDYGLTALMLTAWNGHFEVVQLLLAARADVNAKTKDGNTARSIATAHGHTDIVQLLNKPGMFK
jgi:ankyrin repeat protein